MKFEPGKFYIGVIDFFSVLLPGALLVYLIKDWAYFSLFGESLGDLPETEQWILVAFTSYLLGHFIFLLGSFLDDLVYDRLRGGTFHRQVDLLALGKELKPRWVRFLAPKFFKPTFDKALKKALEIKSTSLGSLDAADTMNVFKWSKTRLNLSAQSALAEVERYEANSKFFRSLFVVLVIILPLSILWEPWYATITIIAFLILSLWRYIDQRKKGVRQAYWSVIVQEADKSTLTEEHKKSKKPKITHGGGIVYKEVGAKRRYLLVQSKGPKDEWVLPKGHMEPGERPAETAVREVREETGVWAKMVVPLGKVEFKHAGENIRVQFFILEYLSKGKKSEAREVKWATLKECRELIRFEETRDLLKKLEDSI